MLVTVDDVKKALDEVIDPDLRMPITDLGLIYDIRVLEDKIEVDYTLTSPMCPVGEIIENDMIETIKARTKIENVEAKLVWDPPWDTNRLSDELKLSLGLPIDLD